MFITLITMIIPRTRSTTGVIILPQRHRRQYNLTTVIQVNSMRVILQHLRRHPRIVTGRVHNSLTATRQPTGGNTSGMFNIVRRRLVAHLHQSHFRHNRQVNTTLQTVAQRHIHLPVATMRRTFSPNRFHHTRQVDSINFLRGRALRQPRTMVRPDTQVVIKPTHVSRVGQLATQHTQTRPLRRVPQLTILRVGIHRGRVLRRPTPSRAFPHTEQVRRLFPLRRLRHFLNTQHRTLLVGQHAKHRPTLRHLMLLINRTNSHRQRTLFQIDTNMAIGLHQRHTNIFTVGTRHSPFQRFNVKHRHNYIPRFRRPHRRHNLTTLHVRRQVRTFLLPHTFTRDIMGRPH